MLLLCLHAIAQKCYHHDLLIMHLQLHRFEKKYATLGLARKSFELHNKTLCVINTLERCRIICGLFLKKYGELFFLFVEAKWWSLCAEINLLANWPYASNWFLIVWKKQSLMILKSSLTIMMIKNFGKEHWQSYMEDLRVKANCGGCLLSLFS